MFNPRQRKVMGNDRVICRSGCPTVPGFCFCLRQPACSVICLNFVIMDSRSRTRVSTCHNSVNTKWMVNAVYHHNRPQFIIEVIDLLMMQKCPSHRHFDCSVIVCIDRWRLCVHHLLIWYAAAQDIHSEINRPQDIHPYLFHIQLRCTPYRTVRTFSHSS